jgi:hypothetical protein
MRFCILILLYSGWAFSQGVSQGIWSADNDNPPGLEEARANNYEKNVRPPTKHPPAYYTADYYEYQVDRKVTFKSQEYNQAPESNEKENEAKEEEKSKSTSSSYAGGGYVQGRRINSVNCTYTCNKKLPSDVAKGKSNISGANSSSQTFFGSSWTKSPFYKYATTPNKSRRKRKSSPFSFKRKSPEILTKKYTAPVVIQQKHDKKPSISPTEEGSNFR